MRYRQGGGRRFGAGLALVVFIVISFSSGCATKISTKMASPFGNAAMGDEEKRRAEAVLKEIEDRNSTVEKDDAWKEKAYKTFFIKSLSSIESEDYAKYVPFLDKGRVYVIVHPAYYTFFHENDLFPSRDAGMPDMNVVEKFLNEPAYSAKTAVIKAQEKMLRDFLEFASTERKLVILIMPRGYKEFAAYKYKNGRDEYLRYINEVTNESQSVIYLFSSKANRGSLTAKDRKTLLLFLYSIKAKEILLGGGYVGRCLEDFYKEVEQYYNEDKIYVVPELTAISPADLTSGVASDMLLPDGTVDVDKLSYSLQRNVFNQEVVPKLRSISQKADSP